MLSELLLKEFSFSEDLKYVREKVLGLCEELYLAFSIQTINGSMEVWRGIRR
jgi:hypothetical protein